MFTNMLLNARLVSPSCHMIKQCVLIVTVNMDTQLLLIEPVMSCGPHRAETGLSTGQSDPQAGLCCWISQENPPADVCWIRSFHHSQTALLLPAVYTLVHNGSFLIFSLFPPMSVGGRGGGGGGGHPDDCTTEGGEEVINKRRERTE